MFTAGRYLTIQTWELFKVDIRKWLLAVAIIQSCFAISFSCQFWLLYVNLIFHQLPKKKNSINYNVTSIMAWCGIAVQWFSQAYSNADSWVIPFPPATRDSSCGDKAQPRMCRERNSLNTRKCILSQESRPTGESAIADPWTIFWETHVRKEQWLCSQNDYGLNSDSANQGLQELEKDS